jgi:hypothetical protein
MTNVQGHCKAMGTRFASPAQLARDVVTAWQSAGDVEAELEFSGINVATLPPLPAGVRILSVTKCFKLQTLPPLPISLTGLVCIDCPMVHSLPPLPVNLTSLHVHGCAVLRTVPRLPAGLVYLTCCKCPSLTTLPTLPPGLRSLCCNKCPALTALHTLPATLCVLHFRDCDALRYLPPFPLALAQVNCDAWSGLPDAHPPRFTLNGCTEEGSDVDVWRQRVRRRHAEDRARAVTSLPTAALLFV